MNWLHDGFRSEAALSLSFVPELVGNSNTWWEKGMHFLPYFSCIKRTEKKLIWKKFTGSPTSKFIVAPMHGDRLGRTRKSYMEPFWFLFQNKKWIERIQIHLRLLTAVRGVSKISKVSERVEYLDSPLFVFSICLDIGVVFWRVSADQSFILQDPIKL